MKNKRGLRQSESFIGFLENYASNRVKLGLDKRTMPRCKVADVIVKYFKDNNDRYLELVNMEVSNGNK